jgi:hypothetical protein
MLRAVQRGLEELYRVETELDVDEFVIDDAARSALGVERAPREQLLVHEQDGELGLALYLDPAVIANLAANDPRRDLGEHNLQDFLLAVEGVSHFVFVAWRARQARPVSALELELQAEVDKWASCVLTAGTGGAIGGDLRARLFERFELEPGMGADERERYLVANDNARRYADLLHERFVAGGRWPELIAELRKFYRLGMGEKLELISRA